MKVGAGGFVPRQRRTPAGVTSGGINEAFRASVLPPPCYPDDAEQAGAEEEDGGGFGDRSSGQLESKVGIMPDPTKAINLADRFVTGG